jgi:hypothetical protein
MCAGIRVLDNDIENFKMLKNDAQRSISFLNNRIRTKTEFRKDSGNQRVVECDVVNKGVIGAVRRQVKVEVHEVAFGRFWLRDYVDRDEGGVVYVVEVIDGAVVY